MNMNLQTHLYPILIHYMFCSKIIIFMTSVNTGRSLTSNYHVLQNPFQCIDIYPSEVKHMSEDIPRRYNSKVRPVQLRYIQVWLQGKYFYDEKRSKFCKMTLTIILVNDDIVL